MDRLLLSTGSTFCRFADDYHLFAESADDANRKLIFLSEKLLENEGLLLQKSKTRVMTSEEFLATSEVSEHNIPESPEEASAREFLRLRLHFDPYSLTATEEYEQLKSELSRFDIVGLLAREMRKSRIHTALTRRLISAVQHLSDDMLNLAVMSIIENLEVLYPVFPSVILLLRAVVGRLDDETKSTAFSAIRSLIVQRSYIVAVPTNLAFAIRILAHDPSEETDIALSSIFEATRNVIIRRDVILAMARRGADYWISDAKNSFAARTSWEKTALLIASFILGDEGDYWRSAVEIQLTPSERLALEWAKTRMQSGTWEIPI